MISHIFLFDVSSDQEYIGIWSVFVQASILQGPLHSVYPLRGKPNVPKDLCHLIQPRRLSEQEPCYIM